MRNYNIFNIGNNEVHKLYKTEIVTIDRDNKTVTLNTGGWMTKTTKKFMNIGLSHFGACVKQTKGNWYLITDKGYAIEFNDSKLVVPMSKF